MNYSRDILSRVICNIRIPLAEKGFEIGTGVFISRGENDFFLLTAAHVVKNINPQTYVVVANDKGNPIEVSLSTILGGNDFEFHPTADIAIARITINGSNSHFLADRFFPASQLDLSGNLISKDLELTTIGFPLGYGASGKYFSPLTYRTFVSSQIITLARFDNNVPCDFIILEKPSIGGYSGGPVFDLGYVKTPVLSSKHGPTILHGLIHGTISDATGGKLAAVTPLKYLKGMMDF